MTISAGTRLGNYEIGALLGAGFTLYPLRGGNEVKLPEISRDYALAGWSADSKALYLVRRNFNPADIARFDIATRTITPLWSAHDA